MAGQEAQHTAPCRRVTAQEAAHYREQGWVRLPGFVTPEMTARLLAMARASMGDDGQGNDVSPMAQPFFNPEATTGPYDPELRPLLDGVGAAGRQLIDRHPGIGLRYFGDFFAAKLPAARQTLHPGAGATYYHQDFMNWAVDRSGGMTFWVALTDLAPESGTMSFLSGSHRMGALAHYRTHGPGGLLDDYPELAESCPDSGPIAYRAGDATVHSSLTVHGAQANRTDGPRWAWIAVANPSDVRWTGAPPEAFDTTGMTVLQPLDDARFPLLGQAC